MAPGVPDVEEPRASGGREERSIGREGLLLHDFLVLVQALGPESPGPGDQCFEPRP